MTFDDAQSKSEQVCSCYLSKADQGQFRYYVRTLGWVGGSKNGYHGRQPRTPPVKGQIVQKQATALMTFDDAQSKSDQICSVYLLN